MPQLRPDARRREKPVLSCNVCRERKLRCDRQSPCGMCVRRGKDTECTYETSEQERREAIDYRPHNRSRKARQRLDRLESMVTEMRDMTQGSSLQHANPLSQAANNASTHTTQLQDRHVDGMGKLSVDDNHTLYTGSSHWATILDDLQYLRDDLSSDHPGSIPNSPSTPADTDLMHGSLGTKVSLLNSAAPLSFDQILGMIPPRKVVDRNVSHFFNSFDLGPFIIDRKQFLAEYAKFWTNPKASTIPWLGLLASMMTMSAFLQQQVVSQAGVPVQDVLNSYRNLTIQCLVAGDYLRPSRYTIETLVLHFAVDQNVNVDASIGNWILLGVVIRISFRLGLHRDPSHWPEIDPLQSQLRRRLWIMLYQMDFFTSTQVGMPRIIKDSQCDTRPPAHLRPDDVGFGDKELPSERSVEESTPLLHIIQRDQVIKVAAEIYDATEAGTPSESTMAELSAKLEGIINSIPAELKFQSLESSIMNNTSAITHQIFLDILIHKATYLLHRRSFLTSTIEDNSNKSHELCINAALAILHHQRRMAEETQPGGLMFGIRWKVSTSLNQEFLQATMMLCFALIASSKKEPQVTNSATRLYRRDDIVESLEHAKSIWEENAAQSIEARRAARAVDAAFDRASVGNRPSAVTVDGLNEQTYDSFGSFGLFDPMALSGDTEQFFGTWQGANLDPSLLASGNDTVMMGTTMEDLLSHGDMGTEDIV